jgi:DNA polymerase III subunit beta
VAAVTGRDGAEDRRRGIGAMARASGLTVSALRFYDGAGVLRPAGVDPASGYRWYADRQVAQARLIAALRRVRMPVPEIAAVLAAAGTDAAADLLRAHLRRLEQGLSDARRQLGLAHDLLTALEAPVTTFDVRGTDLAAAIAAVRYAVGTDPDHPQLAGILVDYDGDTLRLVATDRHRLAVAAVPASGSGPAVRAVVPPSTVDTWLPAGDAPVALTVRPDAVSYDGRHAPASTDDYPDYRRLLRTGSAHEIAVARADLRTRVAAGPTRVVHRDGEHEVAILRPSAAAVAVVDEPLPGDIAVNREFLLEALDSHRAGQLTLGLDGPVAPLAFTGAGCPDDISLLMPVRLS